MLIDVMLLTRYIVDSICSLLSAMRRIQLLHSASRLSNGFSVPVAVRAPRPKFDQCPRALLIVEAQSSSRRSDWQLNGA